MRKDDQNSTVMRTGSLYWKQGGGGGGAGGYKNQKFINNSSNNKNIDRGLMMGQAEEVGGAG